MTIWITGDTHFGHTKLGRSMENFEDLILSNLKKQIRKHDILIHLGDFALKHHKMWLEEFAEATHKCDTVYLVRGNHDQKGVPFYRDAFDSVTDGFFLRYAGQHIYFSHMPNPDLGDVNIHGHLHEHVSFEVPKCIKYAQEDQNYMPVSLDYMLKGRIKNACYVCRGTGCYDVDKPNYCFVCKGTGKTSYDLKDVI